jgi:hypothetical protein
MAGRAVFLAVMLVAITSDADVLRGTTEQSPLLVAVTTNRRVHQVGRPVRFTVTETNISDHDVGVEVYTGCDGFSAYATHNGTLVWRYFQRAYHYCTRSSGILHAGASRTFPFLWNGRSNQPGIQIGTGAYTVRAEVDGVSAERTIRLRRWRPLVRALVMAVTTSREVYQVGDPVRFTVTETNSSDHDAYVWKGCGVFGSSVTHHGTVVWISHDWRRCAVRIGILQAGASRTLQFLWDGQSNQPGIQIGTGAYTVRARVDGISAERIIRLRCPRYTPGS